MRVLVTGGSGYLGSRLLAALVARGDVDEVVDVDLVLRDARWQRDLCIGGTRRFLATRAGAGPVGARRPG